MEYDFVLNRRVKISYNKINVDNGEIKKSETVEGFVIKITKIPNDNEKIFIILDDGYVHWVMPRGYDIKNFKVTILDWDPKNPKGPEDRISNKFSLLDIENNGK